MPWSRYLITLATTALLCLFAVATINVTVDPAGIYGNDTTDKQRKAVERYVRALMASPYGLERAFNERRVKRALALHSVGDCFVTGSSQQMQVGADSLSVLADRCDNVINLAVSGGTFEDMVTSVGFLMARDHTGTLVIGIGPWMLRANADRRWTTLADDYVAASHALGLSVSADNGTSDRLANLINFAYLERSLETLRSREESGPTHWRRLEDPTGASLPDDIAFLRPNGVHIYSRRYLSDKPLPPAKLGSGTYKISRPFIEPEMVKALRQVVQALRADGWSVLFLLSPYNPIVFECHESDVCAALETVERTVRELADVPIIGSYRPQPFGLTADDFYDDIHLSYEGLRALRYTNGL